MASSILEETKDMYYIAWEGTDANGVPYQPTWETKDNVGEALVREWEQLNSQQDAQTQGKAADGPAANKKPAENQPAENKPAENKKPAKDKVVGGKGSSQDIADEYYPVVGVVRERRHHYLISWVPDAQTGQPFPKSWEPKCNVTKAVARDWNKEKKERRQEKKQKKRQQEAQRRSQFVPPFDPSSLRVPAYTVADLRFVVRSETHQRTSAQPGPSNSEPDLNVPDQYNPESDNNPSGNEDVMEGVVYNDGKPATPGADPPTAADNEEDEMDVVLNEENAVPKSPMNPVVSEENAAAESFKTPVLNEENPAPEPPKNQAGGEEAVDTVMFDDGNPYPESRKNPAGIEEDVVDVVVSDKEKPATPVTTTPAAADDEEEEVDLVIHNDDKPVSQPHKNPAGVKEEASVTVIPGDGKPATPDPNPPATAGHEKEVVWIVIPDDDEPAPQPHENPAGVREGVCVIPGDGKPATPVTNPPADGKDKVAPIVIPDDD
ncbi:putative chromo domain-like protein [Neofusicoccum parvum UCRNP2]|uniref:Putative chromo domain-like protein n=1 Tax=Botryosphaeria parva (strain UCR-NP2) TaxID=1287680 RepID=R1GH54_BOTPV|nr:putative chromo domain-like protein [Neofusicoccum parvum UCRNP2]